MRRERGVIDHEVPSAVVTSESFVAALESGDFFRSVLRSVVVVVFLGTQEQFLQFPFERLFILLNSISFCLFN